MSSISDIIKTESENVSSIYLYQEGIFWKVYQKSAYAVHTRFRKDFMVKTKFVKVASCNVYSIGFPLSSFPSVFQDAEVEKIGGKIIRINTDAISEDDYARWTNGHQAKAEMPSAESRSGSTGCSSDAVIKRLRDFNLSSSTPLQCMMLVSELQTLLKE